MTAEIVLYFVLGLVALVVGAELLVAGAARLARRFGVSPLVVGLTVVAFGTSAPELAVSVFSAWNGNSAVSFGNVVGSNIFNVLGVLGISAVVAPLVVSKQLLMKDVPIMIASAVLCFLLGVDGVISRFDGVLLAALLFVYTTWVIRLSRRESAASKAAAAETAAPEQHAKSRSLPVQVVFIVAGLVLLVLGSDWFVDSAIQTAKHFGISDLVIGLTIVAVGTSLPELATSIMASVRGEREIAIGNVVGSNIFNVFCVLGISATVAPDGIAVPQAALAFDVPVMLAVAFVCLPIFFTGGRISRGEGAVLLGYYFAYTIYLVMANGNHESFPAYAHVMGSYAIPLSGVVVCYFGWRTLQKSERGAP